MAENSKIEWTHHTFNPWTGCSKVSEGCANCYAESSYSAKVRGITWGPKGKRVVAAESGWKKPLAWDGAAKAAGERHRVFCASMADVFEDWSGDLHDAAGQTRFQCCQCQATWAADMADYDPTKSDDRIICHKCKSSGPNEMTLADVRRRLFALIDTTPNLDWLLLTKRPENIAAMWAAFNGWRDEPRPNVWLGVSVENQDQADKRIPHLLKTPAAVRFLSCEPLLGPVDLLQNHLTYIDQHPTRPGKFIRYPTDLHWVIAGGESGHGARPCNYYWLKSIVDQCRATSVPVFVKQWGSRPFFDMHDGGNRYDDHTYHKLTDRKGGDMSEWPEDLRVREFPKMESVAT